MAPPHIHIKFRGDGGPEYTGPERRGVGKKRNKGEYRGPEDRVAHDIRSFVANAMGHVFGKKGTRNLAVISYQRVKGRGSRDFDDNEARKSIIDTAIGQAAWDVADDAIRVSGIQPTKARHAGKNRR